MSSYAGEISRLREHEPFLAMVCTASQKQGEHLLRTASKDQIETLCEIAANILAQRVPLSPTQIEQLRQIKRTVYLLANRNVPWIQKRTHIARQQHQQKGGFPPLLALLAPIVGGALGALTEKLVRSKLN
jgi:hypothetical protein